MIIDSYFSVIDKVMFVLYGVPLDEPAIAILQTVALSFPFTRVTYTFWLGTDLYKMVVGL